jgi:hypothetical protein
MNPAPTMSIASRGNRLSSAEVSGSAPGPLSDGLPVNVRVAIDHLTDVISPAGPKAFT